MCGDILLLNKERALKYMEINRFDALIATLPQNVNYVTEFWSPSHYCMFPQVYTFAVFPRDLEPALVALMADADLVADSPCTVKDIRFYGEFYVTQMKEKPSSLSEAEVKLNSFTLNVKPQEDAIKALIGVIQDRGLDRGKLGLDESGVRPSDWKRIKKFLPQARLSEAASVFREIRMVKTREELERLRLSAEITEKGVRAMHEIAKEGTTEEEIAREFMINICKEGASIYGFVMGCGTRSAFANAQPTSYKLRKGDFIRFDGGCIYMHYYSDIASTAVLGEPSTKQKKYWRAVLRGTQEAINAVEPGVKPSRLFEIAIDTVRKEGIPHYRRNHVGHGIGIELYDLPSIRREVDTLLEENMVINIETPYYEVGFGGPQVEHTIAVTKRGFRYLTTFTKEMPSI